MPTTIGRNRRQYLSNVRETFTECRQYNHNTGEMDRTDADYAWAVLLCPGNKGARLVENDDQSAYTIISGHSVFELRRPA